MPPKEPGNAWRGATMEFRDVKGFEPYYSVTDTGEGGLALYGKPWALVYPHRKADNGHFFKGPWLFEERR